MRRGEKLLADGVKQGIVDNKEQRHVGNVEHAAGEDLTLQPGLERLAVHIDHPLPLQPRKVVRTHTHTERERERKRERRRRERGTEQMIPCF